MEVANALARGFRGQGLGAEAAQGILDHGFEKLELKRLICLIDPENQASQRVAEKIGLSLEKRVDGIDGDNLPAWIYSKSKAARL